MHSAGTALATPEFGLLCLSSFPFRAFGYVHSSALPPGTCIERAAVASRMAFLKLRPRHGSADEELALSVFDVSVQLSYLYK